MMIYSYFFMFMGYIFTASLIIFFLLLLPVWYIGRNNAKKRNKCNEKYDDLECLYYFDAKTEEEALINWVNPENELLFQAFLSNLDVEVKDYTCQRGIIH